MSYLSDSPSLIMQTFLVGQSLFALPSVSSTWPLYASHMPDVDNVGAIYDTPSILVRRVYAGSHPIHYGIRIDVRCTDYETGWLKCKNSLSLLEITTNTIITVDDSEYTLGSVTPNGGIIYKGIEPGTKRRYLFENEYILTLEEN